VNEHNIRARGPVIVNPLEVPSEHVEEFAQAARQVIDARLRAHPGECPDFWEIVTGLYVRGRKRS
jgi:hypothetical protein